MNHLPVIPDPPAAAGGPLPVARVCGDVVAWAARSEDIDAIHDANRRLAAIDTYLERTSTEGRSQVATAMRQLEVRIGQLLGPATATAGPGRGKASVANDGLSRDERHDFRTMAAHSDVVDDVIASSTDERPASRRQVLSAIRGEDNAPKAEALGRTYRWFLAGPELLKKALAELEDLGDWDPDDAGGWGGVIEEARTAINSFASRVITQQRIRRVK